MQVFRDYRLIECEMTMRRLTPIAIREVAVFDTEDVAPVVHAHYEKADFDESLVTCSNCGMRDGGEKKYLVGSGFEYCPCCGAKMDEEVE